MAHKNFMKIRLCLDALSTENSLVLQLFKKHIEYEPDVLIYINDCMTNNQPLKELFHTLLQKSYELQYYTNNDYHLLEDTKKFLLMWMIKIYMWSRQWSWRQFKEYVPEKGSLSL
ncbi:31140_t:CDS:2 [Gigaspora margarita]|uniref:31140_t:CDS:1 n=1 Tax=Gigaspora margarita TaxID=4874 RepID=A0ABN7VYJ4_GIGMA|nr:31140_t:CDS:2 [Gigaspora margarita]